MNQTLLRLGKTGRSLERRVEESHRQKHRQLLLASPKQLFGKVRGFLGREARTHRSTEESIINDATDVSVFTKGQSPAGRKANILTHSTPELSCMFNVETQSVSYVPHLGVQAISNRDLVNGRAMHFHNLESVMCDQYCSRQCPDNVHGLNSCQSQQTFSIPTRKDRKEVSKYAIKEVARVSPKSIQKAKEQSAHKYNLALADHRVN